MTEALNILTVLLQLKYKIERAKYSKGVQPGMTTLLSKQTNVGSTSCSQHCSYSKTLSRKHIV